jgi:hypothetical protein
MTGDLLSTGVHPMSSVRYSKGLLECTWNDLWYSGTVVIRGLFVNKAELARAAHINVGRDRVYNSVMIWVMGHEVPPQERATSERALLRVCVCHVALLDKWVKCVGEVDVLL